MAIYWENIFENFGIKTVSKTDKSKSAYVLNTQQKAAMDAAGRRAEPNGSVFNITILLDPETSSVSATRYDSERVTDETRKPEPRVGREFISDWLKTGDRVVIGNIGTDIFAAKLNPEPQPENQRTASDQSKDTTVSIIDTLADNLSLEKIYKKARAASESQKNKTRTVIRHEYSRNDWIAVAAISRSKGRCEMPKCTHELFMKDNGKPYLEVHHIVPLSENGPDTIENTAALCPHCHRNLHSGIDRKILRILLKKNINQKMKP